MIHCTEQITETEMQRRKKNCNILIPLCINPNLNVQNGAIILFVKTNIKMIVLKTLWNTFFCI